MLMHYSQGVENFFGNKEDEVGPFPLFLSYELENTEIESYCVSYQYSSKQSSDFLCPLEIKEGAGSDYE